MRPSPGWGCRRCMGSSPRAAERSGWRAVPGWARPSASSCRASRPLVSDRRRPIVRIALFEYCSAVPRGAVPRHLAAEGRAMRDAVADDLRAVSGIEVHVVTAAAEPEQALATALEAADAALVIAPEEGRMLERLTRRVERSGRLNLGPGSSAVALMADKLETCRCLERAGIATPASRSVPFAQSLTGRGRAPRRSRRAFPAYPLVVKPRDGCGSRGVQVVRGPADVEQSLL